MSEVFLYDLKEEKFTEMIPDNPHHRTQARRLHCSAVVGDNLITFGGVNVKNKSMRNMQKFDLIDPHWSELTVINPKEVPHLSRCEMLFVAHHQRINHNLNDLERFPPI